ncbi:MAG: tyrosine-type recombinase/integrase [Legionellales bacterium]
MKRIEIKRRPLADTVLATLEPEAIEYRELDGNGLYFRVKPDGNKSWLFRYKKADGKWSNLGLGGYPAVSGSMARKKAAELNSDSANGKNPSISKQVRKAEEMAAANNTFEQLAREWLDGKMKSWVEGTATRNKGALELHVFPVFGKRPFIEILPIEWMTLLRNMQSTGIIEQTNRVRAMCKEIYDLAKVTGRAVNNPLEGVHRFLETKPAENYAHVSIAELPSLLQAMRSYTTPVIRIGINLLSMLGCRPSELREASWCEFDLDKALWTIPAERMKKRKEHLIPLPVQAVQLLNELHYYSGAYPLLFIGRTDNSKPLSNTAFNMALKRLGYEGRQTPHGFRHITSTLLNEQGFNADHIEAQLSHVKDGVAGVYNKAMYLEQRRVMMQSYADYLDRLAGDNIIAFRRG